MVYEQYFQTAEQARYFALGLERGNNGDINVKSGKFLTRDGFKVSWTDESHKPLELPEKLPPMTSQEYVKGKGITCPICRERDIEACGPITILCDQAYQPVRCLNPDCEAHWSDCYELSGYDQLKR